MIALSHCPNWLDLHNCCRCFSTGDFRSKLILNVILGSILTRMRENVAQTPKTPSQLAHQAKRTTIKPFGTFSVLESNQPNRGVETEKRILIVQSRNLVSSRTGTTHSLNAKGLWSQAPTQNLFSVRFFHWFLHKHNHQGEILIQCLNNNFYFQPDWIGLYQ